MGGRDEHGRADGKVEQLQVQGSCSGSSSAPRFSAAPTYAMGGNLGNTQNVTSHCHASIYHVPQAGDGTPIVCGGVTGNASQCWTHNVDTRKWEAAGRYVYYVGKLVSHHR